MQNINHLINQYLPHVTTNTLILIILAIVAFYILIKVMSKLIKIVALIAACLFILMSVQSINITNIPVVRQAYSSIEKIIPSRQIWIKASGYMNDAGKINKAINDLKSSK